jgi:hypothetical protein
MDGACSTHGTGDKCVQNVDLQGWPRDNWEDNIEIRTK